VSVVHIAYQPDGADDVSPVVPFHAEDYGARYNYVTDGFARDWHTVDVAG
jgi:uncharacterized glyoxalase superfamily protein PhnB